MTLPPRHLSGLPELDRTLVMGIVNVTPDSFSDGGRWAETDRAVGHALTLLDEGADLVDVGGESTRPGATRPLVEEELKRVLPVIEELAQRGHLVSVDTMRAEVAAHAVAAGAVLVNDVSGGLADPEILSVVADSPASYVAMHWRAHAHEMQQFAAYDDVVAEVTGQLAERVDAAVAAGIGRDRIAIDPGLGFAKHAEHNWSLLAGLDTLDSLELPILLGSSRKSFLGKLLADAHGADRPVDQREDANSALTALVAARGVWAVRVHDAASSVDAVKVATRFAAGRPE